jgi:3-oxoacyl-[acyl-carrier protein] reductase
MEGKNKADAEAVVAGLKNAKMLEANVTDPGQVEAMFAKIQKEYGGLDILVNNAGVIKDRTLKKMTWDEWNAVIQVNLSGAFNCLHAATGAMREGGRIVNIASVAGQVGLFGQANYGASKAGVIGLTKVAAKEFARSQVTVNAVAPGFLNGGMSMDLQPEIKAKFELQIPLGRFGELSEIVETVLFLCSADAGYITGQTLGVNGGFHMN